MTSKEGMLPMGGSFQWTKNIGYKVPLLIVSVVLLVVIWESPPPSFLSYSSLSTSQIQSLLSMPASNEYTPANISSNSRLVVPTVHTDSPGAEENSEPKKRPVETVTPDPRQIVSPVHNTTISLINATADMLAAEEDTQLVEEPAIQPQDAVQQQLAEEKFIIPLLSYQVGTGNQLMEYKSAATIARTLNRTLCLIPFFGGPPRHLGYLGDRHSGLIMEDRYDTDVLSKFVKVISMDDCIERCERKLDVHWRLRNSRAPHWDTWFNDTPRFSIDFKQSSQWSGTWDVASTLGPRNDAKCVGLGGLFPGLRWRGVMYAASTYMQHSKRIMKAADLFQKRALGSNDPNFISVHWRFEESNCRGHPLGLCFSRCTDGAVIANGRASETWNSMTLEGRKQNSKNGFNGVFVSQEDLSGAIYDQAVKHEMHNIYLSTDGWLRGAESAGILKWVVEDLRSKGLNVAGLWMVEGLPNFADGFFVHSAAMPELFGLDVREVVSNHMIALVEQELCLRSKVFVGSGQSSWSLAVADTRRGRRCKEELTQAFTEMDHTTPPEVMEQAVIDKILSIQYTAWPTCRGSYNISINGKSRTKAEDEAPDGWLDYDSCEERLLRGVGQCRRITT
ncbi:unnamed protein product [Calypogeia fissa]